MRRTPGGTRSEVRSRRSARQTGAEESEIRLAIMADTPQRAWYSHTDAEVPQFRLGPVRALDVARMVPGSGTGNRTGGRRRGPLRHYRGNAFRLARTDL